MAPAKQTKVSSSRTTRPSSRRPSTASKKKTQKNTSTLPSSKGPSTGKTKAIATTKKSKAKTSSSSSTVEKKIHDEPPRPDLDHVNEDALVSKTPTSLVDDELLKTTVTTETERLVLEMLRLIHSSNQARHQAHLVNQLVKQFTERVKTSSVRLNVLLRVFLLSSRDLFHQLFIASVCAAAISRTLTQPPQPTASTQSKQPKPKQRTQRKPPLPSIPETTLEHRYDARGRAVSCRLNLFQEPFAKMLDARTVYTERHTRDTIYGHTKAYLRAQCLQREQERIAKLNARRQEYARPTRRVSRVMSMKEKIAFYNNARSSSSSSSRPEQDTGGGGGGGDNDTNHVEEEEEEELEDMESRLDQLMDSVVDDASDDLDSVHSFIE